MPPITRILTAAARALVSLGKIAPEVRAQPAGYELKQIRDGLYWLTTRTPVFHQRRRRQMLR